MEAPSTQVELRPDPSRLRDRVLAQLAARPFWTTTELAESLEQKSVERVDVPTWRAMVRVVLRDLRNRGLADHTSGYPRQWFIPVKKEGQ